MSVKRIKNRYQRKEPDNIPLACKLAQSLVENGWKAVVYPPRRYLFPTLKVRREKK